MDRPPNAEDLLTDATAELLRLGNRPLICEASLTTWIDLIAVVQVALRHPQMKETPPAQRTDKFIRQLIEKLDPDHGELWRLLQLGFDPRFDQ